MGHLWLNVRVGGHLSLNGWNSYGKSKLFRLEICSKNAGLQGGDPFQHWSFVLSVLNSKVATFFVQCQNTSQ